MTLAEPTRVRWWDAHDRAWRRARRLFGVAALIVALYVLGIAAVGVLLVAAVVTGDGDVVAEWVDQLGAVGAIVVALVGIAVATAGIALAGWHGAPVRTRRLARARPFQGDDATAVQGAATAFALAYGLQPPGLWLVEDRAPNALVFGRRNSGQIVLTTGALELPPVARSALVRFQVTALASRAFASAVAAIDLVLLGEWLTNAVWVSGVFVILSVIFGVPVDVAAVYVVSVAALVLVTRPIVLLTDRQLIGLLDDVDELVDLETVRHSDDPAALATLLLELLEDPARVRSRWQIAHRWFERDVTAPIGRIAPDFIDRCELHTRRDLLARTQAAVADAGSPPQLVRRLARAESGRPPSHPAPTARRRARGRR